MAYTVLTYGALSLASAEIINIRWLRSFEVVSIPTVNLTEITQPGNLSAIEIDITARITDNSRTKFNSWTALIATKPLEDLTLFTTNLGEYYLTNLDIATNELDDEGDILRMDLNINFKQNLNFG